MKTSKYGFDKSQYQTYVCSNDGNSFFVIGHLKTKEVESLAEGKSGSYAHLVEDVYSGQESVYNGSFGV